MEIKAIKNWKKLVDELENLASDKNGYIFRGVPNSNYRLTPSAFRPDGIVRLASEIPKNFS